MTERNQSMPSAAGMAGTPPVCMDDTVDMDGMDAKDGQWARG
ncbi:hypothetical protein [Nitratidesulfovibrio oxamicus]|nr:hypothetical protein [Nitratidesulfovibrio oxamicus]